MENTDRIRSGSGLSAILRLARPGRIEAIFRAWAAFKQNNLIMPAEEMRAFTHWLLDYSGLAMTAETHRRASAQLRADLAPDRQLLARVGDIERGQLDLTFSIGAGRQIVGSGVFRPSVIPSWAEEGDYVLVTFSQPRCRRCGCTNEQACPEGCWWVTPDTCSACVAKHGRGRKGDL